MFEKILDELPNSKDEGFSCRGIHRMIAKNTEQRRKSLLNLATQGLFNKRKCKKGGGRKKSKRKSSKKK